MIETLKVIVGLMGTRLNGIMLAKCAKMNMRGTETMPPGTVFWDDQPGMKIGNLR